MAAAGNFVRERIPVPCSVPEAGRLILELVSSSRDSQAEPAGPMTFRVMRRYRPTWANLTGFLIAPLFVRTTEVCRVAVIEAQIGAELLLEGTLDDELHSALTRLGRVPEAARVSTLNPRPVPHSLAPPSPPVAPLPPAPQRSAEYRPATAAGPPPAAEPQQPEPQRPELIDLRDPAPPVAAEARRTERRGDFADLIPPPLLPPGGPSPSERPSAPAGPAPEFQPMHARSHDNKQGSKGLPNGRLPSAFRSPRDAAQPDGIASPPRDSYAHPPSPDTVARPAVSRTRPVTVAVDTGEEAVVDRLLIIGRAPSTRDGEQAELLTVNDPSLSVSKTHLSVEADGDNLFVVDRNSTNGTWIDEGRGALRPVPANQRTAVPPGARVLIGERVLTFTVTTSDHGQAVGESALAQDAGRLGEGQPHAGPQRVGQPRIEPGRFLAHGLQRAAVARSQVHDEEPAQPDVDPHVVAGYASSRTRKSHHHGWPTGAVGDLRRRATDDHRAGDLNGPAVAEVQNAVHLRPVLRGRRLGIASSSRLRVRRHNVRLIVRRGHRETGVPRRPVGLHRLVHDVRRRVLTGADLILRRDRLRIGG